MTLQTNTTQSRALLQRYQEIREQSLHLCSSLEVEDFVAQPVIFVSPPKWHLGHVTWFFENFILAKFQDGYELFNERLNYCFNSYYQSQGPRILRNKRGNLTRPPLREILAYRSHVDEQMARLLGQYHDTEVPQELAGLIEVGLQHEQQHQELLVTDIKYILGHNPLHPPYREVENRENPKLPYPAFEDGPAKLDFLAMPEGVYEIGYRGDGFCWDNELSAHKTYLHEYAIANRLVTNAEYIEFIKSGGYDHFEHWLDEGWAWAQGLEVKAPLYWYEQDGQWWHYTLSGLQPVDPREPVTHISYYEADAYARWMGLRLPTEQEWEAACRHLYTRIPDDGNFVETGRYHPLAPRGADDYQMLGNTWEWTGSAYLPYPNYPRFEGDLGEYNGKFMINQMVLRGGSCATPLSHIRIAYRNFFHADERWQFTGIRLAK
ncbi:MAG: ergothioneine biosynthesis protein EgtB [Lewinellaceae bacterium]|nr:ergothioneine biosynthesis protein EgtB [Phaeodactylibacter sp.]MCB9348760.1 ergothioneine biosynthesis protein EgtB [Lewinellaceae bacterium]